VRSTYTAIRHLRERRCPECGQQSLVRGPTSGTSRSIRCSHCGARWNAIGAYRFLKDTVGVECLDTPANKDVCQAIKGYHDGTRPERACDYCGERYTGRSNYCCLACAVAGGIA
jgi:hypothetical protein